ncbi:phosphoglucomutase-2 [Thrips palmi]|uniref:Phosphoglucomutase-2 n=1 Tax=Thrips palmi TaxID=161013 RepID=A0A6P9AJE3_THRPL|nr:phosphoglucomutase-2 [Thrips palmi]XP_034255581.1 phosphoglucomutase-2 [Thrips palmi]XP_034255590.1 phosphoglucomutase-2 [Thrips palmi]XP_034255598.1 phosphoglucomutase-2 [Thrips palmi]
MKLPAYETGIPALDGKIKEYVEWEKREDYKNQTLQLIQDKEIEKLQHLFMERLTFGTAGLRSVMGPGFNCMNEVTIIQTAQGLVRYMQTCFPDLADKGIIIGYDGRYNSKTFADLTATIFLHQGVKVYLFSDLCPTPFVAFGVRLFKCAAGIMVTASHNPKDDNGYKVYWSNGAQIISPHDKRIQESILANQVPWVDSRDSSVLNADNPKFIDPLSQVMKEYYQQLQKALLSADVNAKTSVKFTYTAMHGVGYKYMKEAFNIAGFKPFIAVEEQKDPDPEFSTVKFPNPEEGKSSLQLSIKTANANGSTIILANDPDADRLAVAEKVGDEWKTFTGNELGALIGWWLLRSYREKNPNKPLSDVYMLSSTVSSKVLKTMAETEGFNFEETLTGFKWMGNRTCELMSKGKEVLFAFEEAIGFMCGTSVVDKDGVSAGVHIAELAAYLKEEGKTLNDQLNEVYNQYGFHLCKNSYYICHKPEVTKKIFERLRNTANAPKTYPTGLLEGKYKVKSVVDLTVGFDSSRPDGQPLLPTSASSQMITFSFENGLVVTLRTSGTEPKIKYYSELVADRSLKDSAAVSAILEEMISAVIDEYLQPELNGIIPKSD